MLPFDLVEIPLIIARDVDVVMRQIVAALNAEVEHEGRAGELLSRKFLRVPPASVRVGNKTRHRTGKVGIHDHGISAVNTLTRAHSNSALICEEQLFDRLVQPDLDTHALRDTGESGSDCAAAADGMENAVFVLEEREDREKAGTAEGRHAEIFRLE